MHQAQSHGPELRPYQVPNKPKRACCAGGFVILAGFVGAVWLAYKYGKAKEGEKK